MSKPAQAIRTNRHSSNTQSRLSFSIGKPAVFWGLAAALLGAALALNWNGLVATGIAPLLVALAPCAAMCALGLCMRKGAGDSCSKKEDDAPAEIAGRPG